MNGITNHCTWEVQKGNITTRWANGISPDNVLPEYPRPQMVRDRWMNLNGLWDYAIVPREQQKVEEYQGQILVPYPVESALSGVKRQLLPCERLWYRRTFTIPGEWQGQRLLLHFGAVDWEAKVYINGIQAGVHTGGYYPFSFEISDLTHDGENQLVVSVWDPTDEFGQERGKQVLRPGGIFYTQISGIWQTVWMEPVPRTYIQSFRTCPDIDNEVLTVEVSINGDTQGCTIIASAFDGDVEAARVQNDASIPVVLKIPSPRLWSPYSPFLYGLKIKLLSKDEHMDEVAGYFGMRKISIKNVNGFTMVMLNNRPIFQSGLLDQGYWPDGLYTAPTYEALWNDIDMAKRMGFNMLRKHIKVEPAMWYYYCDLAGMLVWQDMPSGGSGFSILYHLLLPAAGANIGDSTPHSYKRFGRQDDDNRENYRKELKEMVDALYNFPSIITWVPFNECWGQFDALKTASWIKAYDPSRLVDHASGWYDQKGGDFFSLHTYIRKLHVRGSSNGRAIAISEFGGYGLMEKGHVWCEDKQVVYSRYKSGEMLEAAYKSLVEGQVMPLISKGLCACIYTQLTDVETEVNGLLTYDREIVKIGCSTVNVLNMDLYNMFDRQNPAEDIC